MHDKRQEVLPKQVTGNQAIPLNGTTAQLVVILKVTHAINNTITNLSNIREVLILVQVSSGNANWGKVRISQTGQHIDNYCGYSFVNEGGTMV